MTSLAIVTAVLLRTQCPTPEVPPASAVPDLRDPFAAAAEVATAPEQVAPVRAQLPSELADPFSRRAPAQVAMPGPTRPVPPDLVDPFKQRRVRPEAAPSKLHDPFANKPVPRPSAEPEFLDPFANKPAPQPSAEPEFLDPFAR